MIWNIFKNKKNEQFIKETVALMMIESEIKSFGCMESMQKLDIKSGDILVLRHPDTLSGDAVRSIRGWVIDYLKPIGIRVVVLESGMSVGVLRKEEADSDGGYLAPLGAEDFVKILKGENCK